MRHDCTNKAHVSCPLLKDVIVNPKFVVFKLYFNISVLELHIFCPEVHTISRTAHFV